ncbi:hypothetical protein TVAG_028530 [Trichomonas vaginalis G3]|uniref:Uncharacterized protein n=1 Tax=Trichomonas vaginalis (strain ATCC PRA-98 / G3) TaxID=412133 RepID=A2E0A0_TRIV3|nr:nucleotide-diphospho-sugar transferases family [Trichomonas vaginalis G3]EAY13900.1 hypothetical protein TVAG_028530 [Trichomonas vaginalis G3]KAI5520916.1 nucleotide-diphospho-sugar transferases family [Trichomonas vaginalis G3]|eukprot:XP_001326123.1 hypothetical protein [Trichomonas vaginalis G3]
MGAKSYQPLFAFLYVNFAVIAFVLYKLLVNYTPIIPKTENLLCDWNSSTKVGGTKRDVVFLFATAFGKGLTLCIKSLRSTGSKCRIILFVPKSIYVPAEDIAGVLKYSVEIEYIDLHTRNKLQVPHMDRYEHELAWLNAHFKDVDRVLHTDAFDVFFQGDPFAESLKNDTLTLALEPHQFKSCGWNLAWLRDCYGATVLSQLNHRFILCSGSIGGSAYDYVKLLNLMTTSKEWITCWQSSMDQPILNYLVWTGALKENGIRYKITGCNEGFFTMQWCVKMREIRYNQYGQIISLEDTVPFYLHQYNRFPELQHLLYEKCGLE